MRVFDNESSALFSFASSMTGAILPSVTFALRNSQTSCGVSSATLSPTLIFSGPLIAGLAKSRTNASSSAFVSGAST